MRWSEITEAEASKLLFEAVTDAPLTFYHGTDSASFSSFDPKLAAKERLLWNPLGSGMYATNSLKLASSYGRNVHKVIIPPGCNFRRISRRQWMTVGRSIVEKALDTALNGEAQMDKREAGRFRWALDYILANSSPFDSLLGCHQRVLDKFGAIVGKKFDDALSANSDKTFRRYDFVVFTETLYDPDAWEVVIYNPALQKTAGRADGVVERNEPKP